MKYMNQKKNSDYKSVHKMIKQNLLLNLLLVSTKRKTL